MKKSINNGQLGTPAIQMQDKTRSRLLEHRQDMRLC